ncbi:MAG: hypothetical protein FWE06_00955 [Oscillospiraceae bacterium]|nr:hypothetical protein [Oscillospiraceae bacterium]
MNIFNDVISLIMSILTFGGGFMIIWGLVGIFSNIREKNGPEITKGVWTSVGGLGIILAAQIFANLAVPG